MRKKLKPDQDLSSIQMDLLESIASEYERAGSLKRTAESLDFSITKVRKALITAGVYSSPQVEEVGRLIDTGKTVDEIAGIMNLSVSAIYSYIPYKIRAYGLTDGRGEAATTVNADKTRRYRLRTRTLSALRSAIESDQDWRGSDGLLWKCISLYAGQKFRTRGRGKNHTGAVGFSYELKVSSRTGLPTEELIISSRPDGKTITRSSVELALERYLKVQEREGMVKGPKAAGQIFGASYLYAVFLKWGVIRDSLTSAW